MTVTRLEEHIAVEVRDLDVTSSISEETFAGLRQALYRHSVLVFPHQDITDEQQVAFT
jgi:alpha-ketoglutarate-dependent taurine dioxygenase